MDYMKILLISLCALTIVLGFLALFKIIHVFPGLFILLIVLVLLCIYLIRFKNK